MKTINPFQLEQKKYETIELPPSFAPTLGNLPEGFHMVVYGDSGNGKTEFVMQLVKVFCTLGIDTDWISYEQGHGMDIQQAVMRNKLIDVKQHFQISDPDSKEDNISYFDDLEAKIKKRGSSKLFVIDSVQYTRFTFEQYRWLKKKYKSKAFIWVSHKDGKDPKGTVAKEIAYDGALTILVKQFIASPVKNRYGGWADYVIYEERARLLNPKFFAAREKMCQQLQLMPVNNAENSDEERGVIAHD